MNKDLIIVESPAKVKTIKKFLGQKYLVEASVGHVRDLPPSSLGVDEDDKFTPEYQIVSGKKKVVQQLQSAAAKAKNVYLAPDPDREGEAIAWHVAELLKEKNSNIRRIQFNEITSSAVQEALKNPRDLDHNLFASQQARRILDRLVGYKISPLLWKKVKRGISAGRVQSVALRLIVERERERQGFVPQEYWVFKAELEGESPPAFTAELSKVQNKKPQIDNAKKAAALEQEVQDQEFLLESVQEKKRQRQPKPPFITSSLQQEASNKLGFSAKKTMTLAQRLYEGLDLGDRGTTAMITYMRTDSVRVAQEAREAAKNWIQENLGQEYYPQKPKAYKSKSGAQEAHEAIRPVDVFLTPEEASPYLSRDLLRLYRLIWQRFVASQMAPATFWDTVFLIRAGRTIWRSKGERLIFPGFLKIYTPEDAQKESELPKLAEGQKLKLLQLQKEQKFTQPPARYSEASLVRSLEEKGIGRPSTYAQIISTLLEREYVRQEKRQFIPTELGFTVNDLLTGHFEKLMDVGFTAKMEQDLDQVALGRQDWVHLLQDFSQEFNPVLDKAQKEMSQVKTGLESGLDCPECGKAMLIKFGRNGEFLACSGYPECTYTSNFSRDESGKIEMVENQPRELQKMGTCEKCGSDLVLKRSRTGSRFIACSNYPKCKQAHPYSTGVKCPVQDCPGELVEKSSKRGRIFYACNQYPDCTYAVWNYPANEMCPECGEHVLVHKSSKTRGSYLACSGKGCKYWRKLEED
ncbi:MAG: type I DNA topoisomerase [Thermodesulfobacteriota bacterium]